MRPNTPWVLPYTIKALSLSAARAQLHTQVHHFRKLGVQFAPAFIHVSPYACKTKRLHPCFAGRLARLLKGGKGGSSARALSSVPSNSAIRVIPSCNSRVFAFRIWKFNWIAIRDKASLSDGKPRRLGLAVPLPAQFCQDTFALFKLGLFKYQGGQKHVAGSFCCQKNNPISTLSTDKSQAPDAMANGRTPATAWPALSELQRVRIDKNRLANDREYLLHAACHEFQKAILL